MGAKTETTRCIACKFQLNIIRRGSRLHHLNGNGKNERNLHFIRGHRRKCRRDSQDLRAGIINVSTDDFSEQKYLSREVPYKMAQVPNTHHDADIVSSITDCCSYNGEQYLIKLNLFSRLILTRLGKRKP